MGQVPSTQALDGPAGTYDVSTTSTGQKRQSSTELEDPKRIKHEHLADNDASNTAACGHGMQSQGSALDDASTRIKQETAAHPPVHSSSLISISQERAESFSTEVKDASEKTKQEPAADTFTQVAAILASIETYQLSLSPEAGNALLPAKQEIAPDDNLQDDDSGLQWQGTFAAWSAILENTALANVVSRETQCAPSITQRTLFKKLKPGTSIIANGPYGYQVHMTVKLAILQKHYAAKEARDVKLSCRDSVARPTAVYVASSHSMCDAFAQGLNAFDRRPRIVVLWGDKKFSRLALLDPSCDILCTTPGRLADCLARGSLTLTCAGLIVFDEMSALLAPEYQQDI